MLAQQNKMDENLSRLRASIETNKRDQQVLMARVRAQREIEDMQETLVAQQYGAKMALLQARDKRLEVERDMMLARNKQKELESELASAQSERRAFGMGWRQKTMEDLLSVTRETFQL